VDCVAVIVWTAKLLRTLDFRTGQDDRATWRLDLGLDGLKQKNASFEFSLSLQHLLKCKVNHPQG
jgi:hypothetical protein